MPPSSSDPPSFSSCGPLAEAYRVKVNDGLVQAAAKARILLLRAPGEDFSRYEYLGTKSTRFGNRVMDEKTSKHYEMALRQFWAYAAMMGDYDSMLLLLKKPPAHCPAMDVLTVESFLRFKRLDKGEPMLDIYDEQILDVFKIPMTAEGSWISPGNKSTYRAAIYDLHVANSHTVEYEEACPDCNNVADDDRHKGCDHHLGFPRLYRRGNPTHNIIFTNTVKEMQNLAAAAGYTAKGSSQLLPCDFRLLRSHLLSTHNPVDLQMWVIAIVATKLGLRHDEFHQIASMHFLPEYFEIPASDERIDALALKVYGKSDSNWVRLKLHADHVYPDLCPVRPLLVYMQLLGLKGGFLFPSEHEIKNPPHDGIYKTMICYKTFLSQFKSLCLNVLPERPDMKIGAHVFRKSFYLLGIFGEGNAYDLQASARHKSGECSIVYRKAAQVLYQQHTNNPHPSNNTSKWKSILIDGSDGNTSILLALSGCKILPFDQLADYFVRVQLQVPPSNPLAKDSRFLMTKAVSYTGAESPREELRKLKEMLHPDQATNLQLIVDKFISERVKAILQNNSLAAATAGLMLPAPSVAELLPPQAKRARIDSAKEANDLPGRELLKNMSSSAEKVCKMKELLANSAKRPWTAAAKSFVSKHLNPIMNCLAKHFDGDEMGFVTAYPSFNHTTFSRQCCCGQGAMCAPALSK